MDRCQLCNMTCEARNLTRVEGLDICPFCCQDLNRDTIALWPDFLMFARFDRYPFRPEDYP